MLTQFTRRFSTNETKLRIGKAIRTIPEEYKTFFNSNKILLDESIYDPKLKLFLHLNETVLPPPPSGDDKILLVEGVREVDKFLGRLRMIMKWGHFYWRLSDLSALKLEPVRVIKPTEYDEMAMELKVYWQLKVDGDAFFINDEINFKSLIKVQRQRFFPITDRYPANPPYSLYTGINRYVFDGESGMCKEFHVERIEPKISKSKIEWKWRTAACE